jgi:hypothetical protein
MFQMLGLFAEFERAMFSAGNKVREYSEFTVRLPRRS